MGIKQLYNDNLRKLPNEYGDVSVMNGADVVFILFSSVTYTTRRFMFGIALLFVYVFLLSF